MGLHAARAARATGSRSTGRRLYYAVAEGPEIWSVGLNTDGSFCNGRAPRDFCQGARALAVTSIAFDATGRMYSAQRPALKPAYDYSRFTDGGGAEASALHAEQPNDPSTPSLWKSEPETYAVGLPEGSNMTEGGLSLQYAYWLDGTLDSATCNRTLLATGDHLQAAAAVDGIQAMSADLVRPANAPQQSVFVDDHGRQDDPEVRGQIGDVKAFAPCGAGEGGSGFPLVVDQGGGGGGAGGFPPVVDQGGGGGGSGFPPVVDQGGGGGGAGGFPPIVDQGGGVGVGGGGFPLVVDAEPGGGGGGGMLLSSRRSSTSHRVSSPCSQR